MLLFTPTQHAMYFAIARHLGRPLSEVIRAQLEKERLRLERRGLKVPRK